MGLITSSIARKFVMSLTGLFLIGFLVAHLLGNLSLLNCDGGEAFNEYAHFMKHSTLMVIGEVVMFLGFIMHIVMGIQLIFKNKAARPIAYAKENAEVKSPFSKYMSHLGILLMVLLLWHLFDFFSYKYFAGLRGGIEMVTIGGVEMADMATIVYAKLSELPHIIMYTVFMILISFHLHHGFQSAFQSMGLNHKKYTPIIKMAGTAYAILIPLGFALIPILIYLGVAGGGSCCSH